MKTIFSTNGCLVMAAALAIAITSCTDDTIANDETKQTETPANQHVYTMSVQANKGGADTQTRAQRQNTQRYVVDDGKHLHYGYHTPI